MKSKKIIDELKNNNLKYFSQQLFTKEEKDFRNIILALGALVNDISDCDDRLNLLEAKNILKGKKHETR